MRLYHWVPATLFSVFTCATASASLSDYLSARQKFPPRRDLSLAAVRANPTRVRNHVLELRGVVSGVSRFDDGSNLSLRATDNTTVLVKGSAGAELPNCGEQARALVTVEENGGFRLLSVVTESDIGDYKFDPPKPATPAKAAKVGKTKAWKVPPSRVAQLPNRWPTPALTRGGLSSRSSTSSALANIDPAPMYKEVVRWFNPRLTEKQVDVISRSIIKSSYEKGVDARFIMAIFATESGFKIKARSSAGAMGLGQLMPGTARSLGVKNAYDPVQNIYGAVKLLQRHWQTYSAQTTDFRQCFALVCAAYNAGPGAVKKHGGVPPYRETQQYVQKVASWYAYFTSNDPK